MRWRKNLFLRHSKPLSFQRPRLPVSFSSSSFSPTTGGKLTHTPSFEDFSLGTAADAEEELSPKAASTSPVVKKDTTPPPPPSLSSLARASAPGDLSSSHSPPTPSTPSPTANQQLSSSPEVTKQPSGATLWGSVFHPGRWTHRHAPDELPPMQRLGNKYYDNAGEGDKTTWEEVVKSERLQTLAQLPRTKGGGAGSGNGDDFVDAGQLRAALGPSEDVEMLIAAARDGCQEGDERVPFDVFANLLRNS